MKAVVLHGEGDYAVESVPRPEPGQNEVLVAIKAISICGSDPRMFAGGSRANGWPPYYPFVIGHEFSGEVVALGAGVISLAVGDRVAGEAHCGCGICELCKQGYYTLCLNYNVPGSGHHHYGHCSPGCYAEYQVYDFKALTRLPDEVSYEEGTLVDTAGTALHALRMCGVQPGGYTAILGPGPMGLMALALAKVLGSRTIVIGRGARLEAAKRLGADHIVDFSSCDDVVAAVRELSDGLGAHQTIEAAGSGNAFYQAVAMTRKGGQVGLISIPGEESQPLPVKTLILNQISVHGVRANPNCSATVLRLMEQKSLDLRTLITHCFPLENIREAFDTFVERRDGAIKVILKP